MKTGGLTGQKTITKPGMPNSKDGASARATFKVLGDPIKEQKEKDLLDKLALQNKKDFQRFDLSLSGCSATIIIQTPKKIFLAWVGDTQVVMAT